MFKNYKVWFLFLLNFFHIRGEIRRLGRCDRLEICGVTDDSALKVDYIHVKNPEGKNVLISMKGAIVREIYTEVKIVVFVQRCLNKESLDTCEPFTTIKPINTCAIIKVGNMAWSEFSNAIHPPMTCPFKVGPYSMTNGTLDPEKFKFFPIDNFYWRVKFSMYDANESIHFCADLRVIKMHV